MSDAILNKHEQLLQTRFTNILRELNGLSAQDIALLITNVEKTIREQGKVTILNIDENQFNAELSPSRRA